MVSGESEKMELMLFGVPPLNETEGPQLLGLKHGRFGLINSRDQPPSCFGESEYH